jgi:hypothetical protein
MHCSEGERAIAGAAQAGNRSSGAILDALVSVGRLVTADTSPPVDTVLITEDEPTLAFGLRQDKRDLGGFLVSLTGRLSDGR